MHVLTVFYISLAIIDAYSKHNLFFNQLIVIIISFNFNNNQFII